jgi:molybdate transport system substrate-binding protein
MRRAPAAHPALTVALALALTVAPAGCGGRADGDGGLTVLAAASLTEAFTDLDTNPDADYGFDGSQALARQIEQGAPADVFASADTATMQALVRAGLVEEPRTFARNVLEIAVEPGNPKNVRGLADLARPDVLTVLADPSVPAGDYARRAFGRAGLEVPDARSLELDVKAALAKVALGEADAAVVYATDVAAAGDDVEGVQIPDAHNVVATYPIAVVSASHRKSDARAFVEQVLGEPGRRALRARGFLVPQ